MSTFRNHEKMLYGANKISQPFQINSDRAMGFIISSLQVFNGENLESFLQRSWRIVNGSATSFDLSKTVVHTCAFHFMRNVKSLAKKCYGNKKSQKTVMWIMSLLLNCSSVKELESVFIPVIYITSSKYVNSNVLENVTLLNKMLQMFKFNLPDSVVAELDEDRVGKEKESFGNSEEDFNVLALASPFRNHFKNLHRNVIDKIVNENAVHEKKQNEMFSEKFCSEILKWFFPTVPLWSSLLLGNLSRHGSTASYKIYKQNLVKNPRVEHDISETFLHSNRTTGVSEKRMGTLYNTMLGGKKVCRLDDFVRLLKNCQDGLQRMFTDSLLSPNATSRVVKENWDKKRSRAKPVFSYQSGSGKENTISLEPKKKKYSVPNTSKVEKSIPNTSKVEKSINLDSIENAISLFSKNLVLALHNRHNNCWFNSSIIAFMQTYGSFRTFCEFNSYESIFPVVSYLNICSSIKILGDKLSSVLRQVCNEHSCWTFGDQHDACEYLLHMFENMPQVDEDNVCDDNLYDMDINQFVFCFNCSKEMPATITTEKNLQLSLGSDVWRAVKDFNTIFGNFFSYYRNFF